MFKKIAALGAAAVLGIGLLTGCGASASTADAGYSAQNPLVLTLAHGLSETHTVHIAMTQFAEEVNEKTDGRIQVKIFPNGQLGSENENLEQLQAGVIAMTKVSAPGLATYNEAYNAFGLPYIFNDTEDFYHVMDSQEMQDFFLSTGDDGFVTLTYYTSGARSFYTKDKAIRTPADLKGLKIRVQDMKSQTDNKYIIFLLMNIILLVIGMFMDITPAILIFTPIFLPIAISFGMTEIQFGVMLIFNMCLGNITPPVGSVLFVGCGIGHVSIEQVTSKLIPYFVALVAALLAVTYIPALSLGLPSLMGLI